MAEMTRQEMYYHKTSNWALDMGKHAIESMVVLGLEAFAATAIYIIRSLPSPKDNNEQA